MDAVWSLPKRPIAHVNEFAYLLGKMPKPNSLSLKNGRRKELSPFVVFLLKCILGLKKTSVENEKAGLRIIF